MIAFLASCVVVVALASLVFAYVVCRKVLGEFSEAEAVHRLERAAILRAVVARTSGELAGLDRVAGEAERKRTGTVGDDPRRKIRPEEWDAMIRADLERGLGGEPQPILEGM